MLKQIKKLGLLLGMAGLDGTIPIAASAGLFRPENALVLAILFMAGPGAILTAVLMKGMVRERMFAALLAGIIATIIVVLAAGIGPKLLSFVSLPVMKVFGGFAIISIGLLIMGFSIPDAVPMILVLLGLITSIIVKFFPFIA